MMLSGAIKQNLKRATKNIKHRKKIVTELRLREAGVKWYADKNQRLKLFDHTKYKLKILLMPYIQHNNLAC